MEDQKYLCAQCTIPLDVKAYFKRKQRKLVDADLCPDCRDFGKPVKTQYAWTHPILGKIICVPHKGEVDEDLNPIDKTGKPYMPGERICGLRDCVKRKHVITPRKLVADPAETVLALFEASQYTLKKNPARQQRESGRVTERGSVI